MKDERDFWIQMRRGLLTMVAAIEQRYNLPRASLQTIGQPTTNNATPVEASQQSGAAASQRPLDSSKEGVG
jgi:hypothetical protein